LPWCNIWVLGLPERDMAISLTEETTGLALLASPVRRGILDALANYRPLAPLEVHGMTAAQLASHLNLHVTTVRFHLDQLVAGGMVSATFTKAFGVGRPRKVFDIAPGALSPAPVEASEHTLLELLADSFGSGRTPAQAGARWAATHVPASPEGPAQSAGQWLGKIAQMVDVLETWGYTPNVATSEGGRTCRVDLLRCPFLELARSNPAVVCGVHRGLITGVMLQLGESETAISLEPFVEPELCQAHIRRTTPFGPTPTAAAPDSVPAEEHS
jgi:predicted ArsR family transcriptional regulator